MWGLVLGCTEIIFSLIWRWMYVSVESWLTRYSQIQVMCAVCVDCDSINMQNTLPASHLMWLEGDQRIVRAAQYFSVTPSPYRSVWDYNVIVGNCYLSISLNIRYYRTGDTLHAVLECSLNILIDENLSFCSHRYFLHYCMEHCAQHTKPSHNEVGLRSFPTFYSYTSSQLPCT